MGIKGLLYGRKERNLKDAVKEMLDKIVTREMPDNLEETKYLEYSDLEMYGKMREFNTAVNEYIDEYQERIETLEKQIDDLNQKLLEKGVI